MTTAFERVIDALRDATGFEPRGDGDRRQARCPAHSDRAPSLSLTRTEDRTLVHCHAGCHVEDVLAALSLTSRDLYDQSGPIVARYNYETAGRNVSRVVTRWDPKDFRQKVVDGGAPAIYRLPKVVEAVAAGTPIYVVEGEEDVHAVEATGGVATCNAGGAGNTGTWGSGKVTKYFRGADVVIVQDRDDTGRKHAAKVAANLRGIAKSVQLVEAKAGKDASDHVAAGFALDQFEPIEEPVDSDDWEEPLPLSWATNLPAFPVDALPPVLAAHVAALAEETQTPADLAGSVELGIIAACIGGRVMVRCPTWTEPTNLFVVPVMPPGSRKSGVVAECSEPLAAAQTELTEGARDQILNAATEKEIREKFAEDQKRNASKSPDALTIQEAQAAVREAAEVVVPAWPRLLAADATPEALVSLMANQGGRIAAVTAEAGIFASLTGRYSKTPQLDPILMAHAGDKIIVDRRSREPEVVERPALTMLATIQPFALREMVARSDFGGRGLLARILWCLPVDNVGHRRTRDVPSVPTPVAWAYSGLVRSLALKMAELTDAITVRLDSEASTVLLDYAAAVETLLRRDGALGAERLTREWGSKLVGAVARIAGCLHAAGQPDRIVDPITGSTMRAAVRLGEYYRAHAVAALGGGQSDDTEQSLQRLLDFLLDKHPGTFRARELLRGGPKDMRIAKTLGPLLAELEHLGWIRSDKADKGAFTVHPGARQLSKRNRGDTGDTGDTSDVLAGQGESEVPYEGVARSGDTPRVAVATDLTSEDAETVARVARVAPQTATRGICASCRQPMILTSPGQTMHPARECDPEQATCPCGQPDAAHPASVWDDCAFCGERYHRNGRGGLGGLRCPHCLSERVASLPSSDATDEERAAVHVQMSAALDHLSDSDPKDAA